MVKRGSFGVIQSELQYVEPQLFQHDQAYQYHTSFGNYEIRWDERLGVFQVTYGAGQEKPASYVRESYFDLHEDHTGTFQPLLPDMKLGEPMIEATHTRFHAIYDVFLQKFSKTQPIVQIVFNAYFDRTRFPKLETNLILPYYQVDPNCVPTHENSCETRTYWEDAGLGRFQWTWNVAPEQGRGKFQDKNREVVDLEDGVDRTVQADIVTKFEDGWFIAWPGKGVRAVKTGKARGTYRSLMVPFDVNDGYIDPTFGLTATGSTSYPRAKAITANGNAQIDTAQSVFGGTSGLFDGTGDYLSMPDSVDWAFGTGAFTIDFWIRFNTLPASGSGYTIFSRYVDDNNRIRVTLDNTPPYRWRFLVSSGGVATISLTTGTTVTTGVWYHYAVIRTGNTFRAFQDGTQIGSDLTDTDEVPNLAGSLYIATKSGTSLFFDGWLDEFRISKGIARWTSNFTPPTARYDWDPYTVLLLHMDLATGEVDGSQIFLDDVTTGACFATKATPAVAGSVYSVFVYSHAAGNMRVSIYSISPDLKVWESADMAVGAAAWTEILISAGTPSSLSVIVTDYRLALQWNPGVGYSAGPSYTAGGAGDGNYITQAYGAFPASWGAGTATTEKWSEYCGYGLLTLSLEVKAYPSSVTGTHILGTKGRTSAASTTCNYELATVGTELQFQYYDGAGWHTYLTSGAAITANAWHIFGASYTYMTGSGIRLYVDGHPIPGSWTVGNGNAAMLPNALALYIGARNVGAALAEIFPGTISDMRAYPRILSDEEFYDHWLGDIKRGAPVLDLRFNEGTGTSITDYSGHGNNGTTTGTITWTSNYYVPNSQPRYGVVARYYDRSSGGQAEAQNISYVLLQRNRQPIRFVEDNVPLSSRWKGGQYIYVDTGTFAGRASLENITYIFDDYPRSILTLAYR